MQANVQRRQRLHDAESGLRDDDAEASEEGKSLWPFDQDKWWADEVGRGLQRGPRIDVYLNHWLTLRNRVENGGRYDNFRAFEEYVGSQLEDGVATTETIKDVAGDSV